MSDADYGPSSLTRNLLRRWWLVLLLAVLGAGGGTAYGMLQTPVYKADSYVVVVAEDKNTDIAVNFAQAYGRVITQPEILEQVAAKVGRTSAAALRAKVQASTSPDAPLIEITASARTAARSASIANAAVDALVAYGNQHVTETGVRMASFSRAAIPTGPSSPRPVLDGAVGAATGVLIGGLAVLAGIGRPRETGPSSREQASTGSGTTGGPAAPAVPIASAVPIAPAAAVASAAPVSAVATVGATAPLAAVAPNPTPIPALAHPVLAHPVSAHPAPMPSPMPVPTSPPTFPISKPQAPE